MREDIVLAAYHGPGAHEHYESLRKIRALNLASINQCPIDAARSYLLQVGMDKTACEVFVFIDSDVAFEVDGYERLVQSCQETKAVVAGCYLSKTLDGAQRIAGELPDQDQELGFFAAGGLHSARIVPMGFTAIHRSAVEQMIASGQAGEKCTFLRGHSEQAECYPLFMPMIRAGIYQMEDYAFSLRALAAGVELFFDTRPRLKHYGPHGYSVTDLHLASKDYGSARISFVRNPAPASSSPPERILP